MDDKYSAKIPVFENAAYLKLRDVIESKVTDVKADGKLDLTMREKAYMSEFIRSHGRSLSPD